MSDVASLIILGLGVINSVLLLVLWKRQTGSVGSTELQDLLAQESRKLEQLVRDEASRDREEQNRTAQVLREELGRKLNDGLVNLQVGQNEAYRGIEARVETFREAVDKRLGGFGDGMQQGLSRARQELNDIASQSRKETKDGFGEFQGKVKEGLQESRELQSKALEDFGKSIAGLGETLAQRIEAIRATVDGKLGELLTRNDQKLEEMRKTVDEKLEGTLEKRLGESFKLVSERLEAVQKGLGEMQAMASSVGDLKKVLTNVKTRGTWGEVQLGALLEQILAPEQYAANVQVKPGSLERVEYAIRLPGREEGDSPVWLPIDAKFPQEDYQRLVEATERGAVEEALVAGKALEKRIGTQAKEICEKYILPPNTTDFGILFLPSEGLYAEVLRRPGLADNLQLQCKVVLAGPMTLAALLNSLRMGFRTLAIQRRSSEVWQVLGAVKGEFGKFAEVLAKVKKNLEQATSQIDATEVRTRVINRKLSSVQTLPAAVTEQLMPTAVEADDGELESPTPSEQSRLDI